jgi:hypothetical protein
MNVNLAGIILADATRLFARLSGKQAVEPDFKHWEEADALDALKRACAELGFDLVKREPAKTAEAA